MVQNLKIDIIYYDTPSDFEFEFNLGGCCHSRILNSHTHNPKEMLSSLSKAVSRSRVIIVVGNAHGEMGLINLISKAVGIPLSAVSKDEYGIITPEEPYVLTGALPLVSKDGVLSGCIIESGPQSIILLPDEKALRKDISDNLVFPYITALSRIPETDGVIAKADEEEAVTAEEEVVEAEVETEVETNAETELIEEIPMVDTTEKVSYDKADDNTAIVEEQDDSEIEIPADESDDSILSSGAKIKFDDDNNDDKLSLNDNFVITDNKNSSENINEHYVNEQKQHNSKSVSKLTVAILIILGVMLIIAGLLLYLLVYQPTSNSVSIGSYIKEIFNFKSLNNLW